MNQLMKAELTMSSRDLAELVEKRHDSVKRTVETLANKGVIGVPQIVEYLDSLGRPAKQYLIGQRDSYVVVAQLSPGFTARLVDRWQELERQVAKPALPDFTNPVEAARAWADAVEQKQIAQRQLEQKQDLVINKAEPLTLTKLVGKSAVRGTNNWLVDNGYQTTSYIRGCRVWTLTEKGREFGVQPDAYTVRWAVEMLDVLPPQDELLDYDSGLRKY
jgi:phage regulator Rha-like protein